MRSLALVLLAAALVWRWRDNTVFDRGVVAELDGYAQNAQQALDEGDVVRFWELYSDMVRIIEKERERR